MTLTSKCFKELGIEIKVEWNNRKLLSGLMIESGIPDNLVTKVILAVDKLAKIPSRETLLCMLLYALNGNISGLARALQAVADKKQEA